MSGTRTIDARDAGRGAGPAPSRVVAAGILVLAIALLAGLSAWPIYRDAREWAVVGVSAVAAFVLVWCGRRWRWGSLTIAALVLAFAVLVVPLAVPSALGGGIGGIVRGLGDGLAAIALGWKQLLTLTLPVGSYQTSLVPLMVVVFVSVSAAAALALRGGRTITFAVIPLVLPVLFGTVFGSSALSETLHLGPVGISAPRELGLWLAAFGLAVGWIAWAGGIRRRAAIRLGRQSGGDIGGGRKRLTRAAAGAGIVVVALFAGLAAAPLLDAQARVVPRDRIDPELVVREQTSPLAGYREWKRDAAFESELFEVSSDGALPHRIRIAVLDHYDGVDFSLGSGSETGRFTRFPSGEPQNQSATLRVTIDPGYSGVWVPLAMPLASPPSFSGDRADELADSFYVNRETQSAVAVPTKRGLRSGDGYSAEVSTAADGELDDRPARLESSIDEEQMPELTHWLEQQDLPASGEGLKSAIEKLRARGYLSHSLTDGEGEGEWIRVLGEQYGTRFVTSAGGHSVARIEELFQQLNDQQRAAGEQAKDELLVAGIGDDEQFATAAALLAEAMGFDARVVLGVRLGGEDDGVPGVPACAETCTGENVSAWIEARGADGVWAPIDATPQVEVRPTALQEGEQLPENPTVPEERDANESDPSLGTSDSDSDDSEPSEDPQASSLWGVLRIVGLSLAALALLALLALYIPLVKRLRRKRRRSAANPETCALGAWDELVDARVDAGVRIPRDGSRRDIAIALGVPNAEWLAWMADRAVYSREGLDGGSAAAMWETVDEAVAGQRAGLGFWGRMRARFSLASFGLPRRRNAALRNPRAQRTAVTAEGGR